MVLVMHLTIRYLDISKINLMLGISKFGSMILSCTLNVVGGVILYILFLVVQNWQQGL